MNLSVEKWKVFEVQELFDVVYGVNLELNACVESTYDDPESINFVSRSKDNNGVTAYVKPLEGIEPQKAGTITVAGGGSSVLSTFVQVEPFYSGRDLYLLIPKDEYSDMSLEAKHFVCTVLMMNKYKYSFGRQANKTLPKLELKLPVDEMNLPDWKWMEKYVKSLYHKPLRTKNKIGQAPKLRINEWKEFVFNQVFTLKGGFYNKKPEHSIDGRVPFLASTEDNNGVTEFYSIEDICQWDKIGKEDYTLDKKIYKGNCIAVTVNGSVCNAFYQSEDFTCSHDITAFYLKGYEMNPHLAEFLCTIIMWEKYRWSYGRKPHDVKKFGRSVIKLPIQRGPKGIPIIDDTCQYSKDGYVPDWKLMEDYIKALPYGDRL